MRSSGWWSFALVPLRVGWILLCACVLLAGRDGLAQRTINVPGDAATIQAGIDASNAGDTVLVAPGTYFENIDFKGKAIVVAASDFVQGPGGASDTIIDGGGKGPAVTFANGETNESRLMGFTVRHGGGSNGINIQNDGNQVTAGVLVLNSSPTILDNTITQNNCYGVLIENGSPTISFNVISNTDGTVGNWCDYVAIGTGVLVDGNLAPTTLLPSPAIIIFENLIENNTEETEDASSSGGGGIHVLTGLTQIVSNTIRNNFSQEPGGGIAVSHYNPSFDDVTIEGNLIYGNSSACGGGGLAFNQNTAYGIDAPVYLIYNNTIVDNTDTDNCTDSLHPNGSQVYLWQDSNRFVFANNIIAGTSSTQPAFYCETLRQYYPQYQLTIFDHNDLYNPQGAVVSGHCLDPTGDIYGNISADPLFKDRAKNDYHLASGSPAVDTGNNAALLALQEFDVDNKERPLDATGVGYPIVDIGAYEFPGTTNGEFSATTVAVTQSAYVLNVGDLLTFDINYFAQSEAPRGEISLYQDGKFLAGTNLSQTGNVVNFGFSETAPGVHGIVVSYPEDGYAPVTTIKTYVVVNGGIATTTLLASSLNPAPVGQSVTFTATVASSNGTPAGTVAFADGTTALGPATLVNGAATYTTSSLAVGTHTIAATYNPDTGSSFSGSSGTLSQVVNGLPTTTSLAVTPVSAVFGASVSMSSNVTSAGGAISGGTIAFMDGAATLSSSAITAVAPAASFATQSLAVGVHSITAVYSGDAAHNASTSAPVSVTIAAASTPDFGLASSPPALSVQAGGHTTFTVTASSVGGFAGTLVFSNGGLPAYITLTPTPGQVQLSAGGAGTVAYFLDTNGAAANQSYEQEQGRRTGTFSLAALSPICLLLLARSGKRRWRSKLLGMAVAMMLASSMGCGSKFYTRDLVAAPGSYTIQITAQNTQQGIAHSLTIPLTVTAQQGEPRGLPEKAYPSGLSPRRVWPT